MKAVSIDIPKDWNKQPPTDSFIRVIPIDVEIVYRDVVRSVFQKFHKESVFFVNCHVIWYKVLNPSHTRMLNFIQKRIKFCFFSNFWIYFAWIDHIVPMSTAWSGFKNR